MGLVALREDAADAALDDVSLPVPHYYIVVFVTVWCGVFDNSPSICGVGKSVFEWVCCFGLGLVVCCGVWCGVGVVG